MNNRQIRSLELLSDIRAFLKSRPELRASERLDVLQVELNDIIDVIERARTDQLLAAGARRMGSSNLARTRDALRIKHIMPLVRDAKHILKGLPGLRDDLRLPHKLAPVEQHVDAAKRIRKVIAPHADAFIGRKHPRDFVRQLDDAIAALEAAAAVDRGADRARLSIVTRDLRDGFAEARLIVDRIDATIHAEFSDDERLLQLWDHGNRVPARKGRPRKNRRKAAAVVA